MRLLAIDPGESDGWAVFQNGRLAACGRHVRERDFEGVDLVVIEKPQIYVLGKSKADPNDLISLAIKVGRLAERVERITGTDADLVRPQEWKGSVPKEIHNRRVIDALSADEACIAADALKLVPEKQRHNVIDACGLGLWAVKQKGLRS